MTSTLIRIQLTNINPLLVRDLGTVDKKGLVAWCKLNGYGITAINKTATKATLIRL